jgi:hypothetical protein
MASFFRSPLAVFAAIVVVGLALIAIGMKAYGGTGGAYQGPEPLSRAQFGRAGEHICLTLRGQLIWLNKHKPTNLRTLTGYIARGTADFNALTTEIDRLLPPPSVARSYQRARAKLDMADRAMQSLDHLTQTRQWRHAIILVRSRWWRRIMTQLGGHPTSPKNMRCGRASHNIV